MKKGLFHAKLSHARKLFATTAMVLELRLSKRRSLTRQEDITARRPCHQKSHFSCKKKRLARGFPKKRSANLPRTSAFPRPCQQKPKKCARRHNESTRTSAYPRPCQQKPNNALGATTRAHAPARSQNWHGATMRAHAPARTQFRARLLHRRQLFTHRASNLSSHLDLHQAVTLTVRTLSVNTIWGKTKKNNAHT